jgi:hypothetical protein
VPKRLLIIFFIDKQEAYMAKRTKKNLRSTFLTVLSFFAIVIGLAGCPRSEKLIEDARPAAVYNSNAQESIPLG